MSWYLADTRVKSFSPTGEETLPEDQERWTLFQAVEEAITASPVVLFRSRANPLL